MTTGYTLGRRRGKCAKQCPSGESRSHNSALRKEKMRKEDNERIHHDDEKEGRGLVKTGTACAPCLRDLVPEIARDTCSVH